MRPAILIAIAAVTLTTAACGGDRPAPKSAGKAPPAPNATATVAAPAETAPLTPAPADTTPVATIPMEPPAIQVVSFRFTPSKPGKVKSIEVTSDGNVLVDGKLAGRITGDHLEDATGASFVTVSKDGLVSGTGAAQGLRFGPGDELAADDGTRITINDDGTVFSQKPKATKGEPLGRLETFQASGKRAAALVVAAWYLGSPGKIPVMGTPVKKR